MGLHMSERVSEWVVRARERKWKEDKENLIKVYFLLLLLTTSPKITVEMNPPMNPSHVFLGDSLINLVLPKKNPKHRPMERS